MTKAAVTTHITKPAPLPLTIEWVTSILRTYIVMAPTGRSGQAGANSESCHGVGHDGGGPAAMIAGAISRAIVSEWPRDLLGGAYGDASLSGSGNRP